MMILKWFIVWVLLALVVGSIAGRNAIVYYRLSRRGAIARGVVQEKKPHFLIGYTFEAAGHQYNGTGGVNLGAKEFDRISNGDEVIVHYLPNAPEVNCLGDPRRLFNNEGFLTLLAIIIFPAMIVVALVLVKRSMRPRATEVLH
jgi:amino acid transporter